MSILTETSSASSHGVPDPETSSSWAEGGQGTLKLPAAHLRLVGERPEGEAPPEPPRPVEAERLPPVTRAERGERVPLSFGQERLWFLDRLGRGGASCAVVAAPRLAGEVDARVLERALGEVVRRHEALRTVFREVDGFPVQVVSPFDGFALPTDDLSHLSAAVREAEVERAAAEEAAFPFDLEAGPLFRARLLRLSADDHVLLLRFHPMTADAWSVGVLVGELRSLYAAFREGVPSPLAEPPLQHADFALWQRARAGSEAEARGLAYWRERLAGAPEVMELPADHPRPPVPSFRGARVPVSAPAEVLAGLRAVARAEGTTLPVAVLAAFQLLLARYTGSDDVVVGSPVPGRGAPEVGGVVGSLANTLVLRADLSGDPTFREAVRRARETTEGALAHQHVPFERVVAELRPERSLSHATLFQVLVQVDDGEARGAEGLALRDPDASATDYDLTLRLRAHPKGLRGALDFSVDLFERGTARRMAEHLERILGQAAAGPDRPLSRLELMGRAERTRVVGWNRTTAKYPADRCVHHLFEAQAARTPEAVAVVSGGASLSFRALDERANRLARHLAGLGVGPEVRVGICLERGPDLLAALLGVMKAGGAYVPIDPGHPPERIAYMLEDSGVAVVVTEERVRERIPAMYGVREVSVDGDAARIAAEPDEAPETGVTSENLAYVIYTSGSTGRPKGVAMHHRGVCNYIHWGARAYGADQGAGAPVFTSVAVDLTTTNLLPLFAGKPVRLLPEAAPVEALARTLRERPGFGLLKITPMHLGLLNSMLSPEDLAGATQTLVVGADFLSAEPTVAWQEHAPGVRLINEYGPTEAVVGCSAYVLPNGRHRAGPVPVGRPIQNLRFYVLDAQLEPVPVGLPGELFIGGAGVARGYLGRPGLSAEKFLPDPFGEPGERMYRTGDRARWLHDGNLLILGRTDRQVKVRGFRVELGEVEAALRRREGVRECVALVREDRPGDRRLVAYVVGDPARIDPAALREALGRGLPEYMVPEAIVVLPSLPQTPTGKLDRKTLPAPVYRDGDAEWEAPRNDVERELIPMWEALLGVEGLGPEHSFFRAGGNSLLALRLFAQVNEAFGCDLPVSVLFAGATVRHMADAILERRRAPVPASAGAPVARDLSFGRAVEFAAELIRIPSLSGEEEAVARRIVAELLALGFDEARFDEAGNVIGRIVGTGDAPSVMLSCHMDVVDVGDREGWAHDPHGGVVAGGSLHGRGAMDLKGPLALQVYAAARFVEERPAGDILVAFTVYEEKGGWGMMHLMESSGLRPGAVILGEATGGDLCTGHRGHAELAVEILGRAAHASAPERARNPNHLLPQVLLALGELSAAQPVDPVLGRATLTPTVVECWPKSGNVIPDKVRITLDWRVLPGWDETAAIREIEAKLAERVPAVEGMEVKVLPGRATHRAWTGWVDEHSNFTPGFRVADDHPVVLAAAAAIGEATGKAPRIRPWLFGTDGGHTCGTHDVPTIGYAPGDEALAHTNREHLELAEAREAFDAYPALIRAVQTALQNLRGIPIDGVVLGAPGEAAVGSEA